MHACSPLTKSFRYLLFALLLVPWLSAIPGFGESYETSPKSSAGISLYDVPVFSDFDGTITQIDVTDRILSELAHPSWEEIEQEWARGMIGSRECADKSIRYDGIW